MLLGFCPSQKTQARSSGQCSSPDKKAISVHLSLFHFPLFLFFSSGVAGVSASNTGSMARERSTASGPPGRSGPTAPDPAEEGSCTGSAPAPAQGKHTCTNSHNPPLI